MTQRKYPFVRVGIGVMIMNPDGEALLGLRRRSHGAGEWCFPGGKMEVGQTMIEAARVEVYSETGLEIDKFRLISVDDEMRYLKTDGKQFVNIGFIGKYKGGEPKVMEPGKFECWKWFPMDRLPESIFEGTEIMIKNFKSKKIYP